ncbi:MAG: hypothetical protein K5777_05260 [Nitrosopumilus sp.]|nr:hypothetical protein [Nitrosopumilus sp.]
MSNTRTDNFGILAVVVGIVSSMWLFGLADDVYSAFQIEFDRLDDDLFQKNAENTKKIQIIDDVIQKNTESPRPVLNKPALSEAKENIISSEPVTTAPKKAMVKTEQNAKESLSDKIKRLEQQSFTLSGDGSGYEGAAHLSEFASMHLYLNPVLGTELGEFDIRRGTLNVGGYTFVIGGGQVILESNNISVNIERDDHRDPYLNMVGTISGSILDEKTLVAIFENQSLGLTNADQTPINLSLELKMEIQN